RLRRRLGRRRRRGLGRLGRLGRIDPRPGHGERCADTHTHTHTDTGARTGALVGSPRTRSGTDPVTGRLRSDRAAEHPVGDRGRAALRAEAGARRGPRRPTRP
ncbi:MAG: hypothetical protein AVDCRST_MAG36-1413, partial [uncultured Nocardioidaceae bacterium]